MSTRRLGNAALLLALLVLGLGFVGWVLQDPASDSDSVAHEDLAAPDATRHALEGDAAPAMLDPALAKRHPQMAQLMNDTRLRARKREGTDRDLRHPLPGVKHMVEQDLDAWRSFAPKLAAMLAEDGARVKYDDHAMVSVLEAIWSLPRGVAKSLQARFLQPRTATAEPIEQRIAELILEALGPDEFLVWAVGILHRPELRTMPVRRAIDGQIIWLNAATLGRSALLAVLKRLAAESSSFAVQFRQLVLDVAANGSLDMRDVIRAVLPNDMSLALLGAGKPGTGYLGAKRQDYLRLLDDVHPYVSYLAVRGLYADGQTTRAVLRPAMLRLLTASFPRVRTGVIELAPFVIEKLDYAIGTLNAMLSSEHPGVVADAPKLLARLAPLRGEADVGRLVGRILSRANPVVRKRLISDLTQFRMTAREEVEMLREYVGDRDRTVRLAVVEALGYLGQRNPTADEPRLLLTQAQRDTDAEVRGTAEAWIEELRLAAEAADEDKEQRKVSRHAGN